MVEFQQPIPGMKSGKARTVDVKKYYSGIVNVYQLIPIKGEGGVEPVKIKRPEVEETVRSQKDRSDYRSKNEHYKEYRFVKRGNTYNHKDWLVGITMLNGKPVLKKDKNNTPFKDYDVDSSNYDAILERYKVNLNDDLMKGDANHIKWDEPPWNRMRKEVADAFDEYGVEMDKSRMFELAMKYHITLKRMYDIGDSYVKNVKYLNEQKLAEQYKEEQNRKKDKNEDNIVVEQKKHDIVLDQKRKQVRSNTKKKPIEIPEKIGSLTGEKVGVQSVFDAPLPDEDVLNLRKKRKILLNIKRHMNIIRNQRKNIVCKKINKKYVCKPKKVIKSVKSVNLVKKAIKSAKKVVKKGKVR